MAWHGALCPCCGAEQVLPRRGFLAAAVGTAALAVPPALAQGSTRVLRVRRHFTEDSFSGVYWRDGFVHLDCGPVRRW